MRIGIDAHVLGKNVGGVERFVQELVRHLPSFAPEHDYLVFVTKTQFAKLQNSPQSLPRNVQFAPLAFANPLLERLLVLPWLVFKHRLDALLVQRLAPWGCGKCKLIVTIHDLTPIKFAHAYKGLSNHLVRLLTKNSIRRASLILTPTNTIKAEVQTYCPEAKMPIVAFYNGVDVEKFRAQQQVSAIPDQDFDAPYLLTVGAIERRKNIETILQAMPMINAQSPSPLKLVIVGGVRDQEYQAELLHLVTALGLQDRVVFVGFTEESALIRLYQQAEIFITASKDEGFNIPPLEAMACGTPVLCSDIAVHRELFDGAAQFFAPESANDLCQHIQHLRNDTSNTKQLIATAAQKVQKYNWTQTARNVASSLQFIQ